MIKAVLWDFGGVLTMSPFEAFKKYEQKNKLPENFIRMINATNSDTNAWARLERSEITLEEFDREFEREARAAGHALRGLTVLGLLSGDLRPEMVEALRQCHEHFLTGCLTNNVHVSEERGMKLSEERGVAFKDVLSLFDVVVESSKLGVRKPDPRFYERACQMLEIHPSEAVYLDDLGINLKPARAMGMTTIKVTEPQQALEELGALLGLSFSSSKQGKKKE
jgi:putative hydrolase of the HAD superfamily